MDRFAVLFDMDGLMLDSERMARAAWTNAMADHGYQLENEHYVRLLGRTARDAREILSGIFGSELPFDAVYQQRQVYYDADIETNGISVKPGLAELLDFLEANHITKVVATSTPSWFALRKLGKVGILDRFTAVVCGDMVERGKPFPDVFLEAARRIDLAPEDCVVLEDSEAGILAAHSAGMQAIMIPDLKPPTPEIQALAYRVLPSLYEVIPLFEEFLQSGLP